MKTEDIIKEINQRKFITAKITVHPGTSPVRTVIDYYPKWGICLENQKEGFSSRYNEIHFWKIESLMQGREVIREILMRDGADKIEADAEIDKMIIDMNIKETHQMFVLFFIE